jgi:hypothetical protein
LAESDGKVGPANSLAAVGFLTVVEHEPHGLFGGYLVLNVTGRPLEFHCTTPVRSNRAQQILYGPTLAPYLYGEQIGRTLVEKAKVQAPIVLTDVSPVLALRDHASILMGLVEAKSTGATGKDTATAFTPPIILGNYQLRVAAGHADDGPQLQQMLREVANRLDLAEPFQRIREAITEAHKAA